jgi:hypothetical protein
MLLELINHNDDLRQLLNEGYEVEFSNGYLMIHHVPYVNNNNDVAYGTMVSKSQLSGNIVQPADHTVLWIGDYPCDSKGAPMNKLGENKTQEKIRDGLITTNMFSQKPKPEGVYRNHHHKMTQYIKMLENEAHVIDPSATAITFRPLKLSEEESVFCYMDTATSRAGIASVNEKIKQHKITIVGLGGTGSYILDLVSKTPVDEIHLFDGDVFHNHNAFRSPGAPSYDELLENTTKVERLTKIYSCMRRNIISHPQFIDKSNIAELNSMNFVFLCVDKGEPRKLIVDHLVEKKIPFIDVGISILNENEALTGSVRVTTCTPSYNTHIKERIPFGSDKENEYSSNIQIADMNALNASLAVIKWKKMRGFYHDFPNEHHTVYGISTNTVTNDVIGNET